MLSTYLLVLSFFFVVVTTTQVPLLHRPSAKSGPITFYLRHLHAATNTGHVLFADVSSNAADDALVPYTLRTVTQTTHRPSSFAAHAQVRRNAMLGGVGSYNDPAGELTWVEEEIIGPDVTSRETLLLLAKMTNNAYVYPDESEWYDLGGEWNSSDPFGWEDDADGFRGHVFASQDNTTVVISIKGTSAGFFGGGGATAKKDKLNNNLLFSCCCAYVDYSWSPVCGCPAGGWKCSRDCLEASLSNDSLFYPIGTTLYNNVSYIYPEANIWLIGHSLGGALASLLGVTFGTPVVAYESPGEKMAAQRLHLPSPPSTHHVTHVYHTADPIPMGTCTGVFSACALAGYAMESRCHLGKSIVYDTVTKLKWSVSIRMHQIKVIIEQLLAQDWQPDTDVDGPSTSVPGSGLNIGGEHNESASRKTTSHAVPIAEPQEDCVECYKWQFGDF